MATINTIAIVGASGKTGSAIARRLRGKHRLLLMSRDEAKVADLQAEIGSSSPDAEVYAVNCARDAAWEADIIIMATPQEAERSVAEKIKEVSVGKIVISIAAGHRDTWLLKTDDHSTAETLQGLLPHSKVVKTFNTTPVESFNTESSKQKAVYSFIAGNHRDAVDTVCDLVASIGYTPVVTGDLTMSRALEKIQMTIAKGS